MSEQRPPQFGNRGNSLASEVNPDMNPEMTSEVGSETGEQAPRKKRRPPKRKLNYKRIGALIVVLVVILGLIVYGVTRSSSTSTDTTATDTTATADTTTSNASSTMPAVETIPVVQEALDKPIYILLVGRDQNSPATADVLYLVALNKDQKTMQVIGIPGNSKLEDNRGDNWQMVGDQYKKGGIELTLAAVGDMFHIKIPYFIVADKNSVEKFTSLTGPVPLYVEEAMKHTDTSTNALDINLLTGYQDLDGEKSYGYLRYIDPKGDTIGRMQREERWLKTFMSQDAGGMSTAFHVWRGWSSVMSNISTWDAMKLAYDMRAISNIAYFIVPGEPEEKDGLIYWDTDPTSLQQLVGITLGEVSNDGNLDTGTSTVLGNVKSPSSAITPTSTNVDVDGPSKAGTTSTSSNSNGSSTTDLDGTGAANTRTVTPLKDRPLPQE